MGSKEIITFNLAMIIGLLAGTYSSLFLVGSLYVFFATRKKSQKTKNKPREISEKTIKGIND